MKTKAHTNGHPGGTGLGSMGWRRDLPDYRDYTPDTQPVKQVLTKSEGLALAKRAAPASVDLREWCSPIEDQGDLGSCTANAGVGLVEYFERRAFGHHLDASRLFLYKVTRNLLGWVGDQGAYLRDTMKALVLAGVPPEQYWPYDIAAFDDEPSAFCYAFAQSYKAIVYYRLDPTGTATAQVLKSVKQNLAAGLPSMFGFTVLPWPALAAVADSWKVEWEQTLAAARKEGEISFYGSQGYEKVFEVFQKKYPEIKVNAVTNMRGSEHGARVMTERRAGKYLVDLLSTAWSRRFKFTSRPTFSNTSDRC